MKYNWRHAIRVRWRALHRRCPDCGGRGYAPEIPPWDEDPVVTMFGWLTANQCSRCGREKSIMEFGFYYDREGRPITPEDYVLRFRDSDYKRIDWTEVGGYTVSTVWLGLDHGYPGVDHEPLIFESLIMGEGPLVDEKHRYSTEAAARRGHAELVDLVRWDVERGEHE